MFKWWDPVLYWYRNDIESVSVRKGCTFTGFDDSSLNGGSFTIRSGSGADTSVVIRDVNGKFHNAWRRQILVDVKMGLTKLIIDRHL